MDNGTAITLIIGGARSGKSAYAETLIEGLGGGIYLATAEAGDDEMRARISAHRARRGAGWKTVEEAIDLTDALGRQDQPVLVDCLTLWLSNLMMAERDIESEFKKLISFIPSLNNPVIFVTNEVGQGIVPTTKLARDFRDHAGRLNQLVAGAADRVILMAAGLPQIIK